MHARWPLAIAVVLLAGCSEGAPDPSAAGGVVTPGGGPGDEAQANEDGAVAKPGLDGPVVLVEGRAPWMDEDPLLMGADAALVATGFCWNAEGEPFQHQFHLTEVFDVEAVPAGTGHVEVTASWSADDWAGEALRVVYDPGNGTLVIAADLLASGSTVALQPSLEVGSMEPVDWDIWLCTTSLANSPDGRLRPTLPFVGDVGAKVVAVP